MNTYNHINISFLEGFTNKDPSKMAIYIKMFLQSAPQAIQTMKEQYAAGDMNGLRTTAHSLKPQLGYMGIDALKEPILRIEEYAAGTSKTDEIPMLLEIISQGCALAFEELRDLVDKLS